MSATIVNPRHDRGAARGITPPGYGYLLLPAAVAPPAGPPFVRPSAARSRLLRQLTGHLDGLRQLDSVVRATGYRAVLIPPARPPKWAPSLQPPRFDVAVLVETVSPDALATAAGSPQLGAVRGLLRDASQRTLELPATCVRAIADVDKDPDGVYLFNFWAARDTATALDVWDHLAPWFQSKTGLENSTVLQPAHADDDLAVVNHARWDHGLVRIAASQFLRPSFYSFVRPNLAANQVNVYPALYRRI